MEMLIDIKPRRSSYCFTTNLLYKKDNIFLMNNHRMAAWCWSQNITMRKNYTFIHIDKHYDTSSNQLSKWIETINNGINCLSLEEYNNIQYQHDQYERFPVFKWDNYIPIFHHFYSRNIIEYIFYTHGEGTFPEFLREMITEIIPYSLITDFPLNVYKKSDNLIINLDIDYFFSDGPNYNLIFSDYSIETVIATIMKLAENKNKVLTIAISPECCGGWSNSIDFVNKYFKKYGITIEK